MADKNDRLPQQPDGKFYVDSQCIDCNLCRETAPENFKRDDNSGYSYVYKQPESPEEEKLSQEALEACPVEAIGSDGCSLVARHNKLQVYASRTLCSRV